MKTPERTAIETHLDRIAVLRARVDAARGLYGEDVALGVLPPDLLAVIGRAADEIAHHRGMILAIIAMNGRAAG